jgi:hypothetical protein
MLYELPPKIRDKAIMPSYYYEGEKFVKEYFVRIANRSTQRGAAKTVDEG